MKVDTPILRRLGPVPFWRGSERCLDGLERIYRRAIAAAEERLGGGLAAPRGAGHLPTQKREKRRSRRSAE